jgi:predicted RNA-binding protein
MEYPDGKRELIMESVGLLRPEGAGIYLRSIFGEEKTIPAILAEMNLTGHSITLSPRD